MQTLANAEFRYEVCMNFNKQSLQNEIHKFYLDSTIKSYYFYNYEK